MLRIQPNDERSDSHDVDVDCGRFGQAAQVDGIGRENDVAVCRDRDHCSVDGIGGSSAAKQQSRAPSKRIIERRDGDGRQQSCKLRLAAASTSPHLRDYASVGERHSACQQLALQQRGDVAIAALHGQ